MKLIGITGPTGAGKTTALNVLREFGGAVIDCDAVYHKLIAGCRPMREELTGRFGDIFLPEGGLDRQRLGELVFSDPAALADLNAITHRYVGAEVDRLLREARAAGCPAAAVDAIALLEGGLKDRCDATVAILAPLEDRVKRIMAREGIPEDYARKRAGAQKEDGYFRANCTYTLMNDGDPADFAQAARSLFAQLLRDEQNSKGGEQYE